MTRARRDVGFYGPLGTNYISTGNHQAQSGLKPMNRFFRLFWRRTDAATSVEYAVMLAVILMVIFGAVAALGTKNNQAWTNTNNSLGAVNMGS